MFDLEKEKQLLTFLQLTKEREYVEIDINKEYIRFPYLRIEEEENYYYNIR